MIEYKKHFLYPAAMYASKEPHVITTLLGSCVSIFLYDTYQKIGGVNHYMLPLWNGDGLASPKFGNIAIKMLLEKMKGMGSRQDNLVAKVFGGAAVLETKKQVFFIGDRNVDVAYEYMKNEGIKIIAASTRGKQGRKLLFNTYTGEVKQKYIEKVLQGAIK